MSTRLARLVLLLLMSATICAQEKKPAPQEREIRATLERFIQAFDNLDWDNFRAAFDDNATVFYPRAIPERANGRAEFEKSFKVVFAQIRGNRTTPPYMDIQPKDLKLQVFGNTALATFHLDDRPGFLNRRTIALRKTGAGWKIVHLHASEVTLEGVGRPVSSVPGMSAPEKSEVP